MKSLAACFLVSLSISSFASFADCYDEVSDHYFNGSRQSRYSRLRQNFDLIEAGNTAEFGRKVGFGPYDEDKLAYHATGSIHSGWFHNVIIVDKNTCEVEEVKMVADE